MFSRPKITPHLWFDREAEEAAQFYCAIFDDSRILAVSRYGDAGPGPAGSVMAVSFELAGQRFAAINGGPAFTFSEAVSFLVDCQTQEEIDFYWDRLGEDGSYQQCGWLKDRYGVSWQVNALSVLEGLAEDDPAASGRVMEAMMAMEKIDIAAMKHALQGN